MGKRGKLCFFYRVGRVGTSQITTKTCLLDNYCQVPLDVVVLINVVVALVGGSVPINPNLCFMLRQTWLCQLF